VLNSNRLVPDYRMTMANIKNFTHAAYPAGTAGMLCTVWDDGGNAFFPLDWYGVAYAADQSWHVNDDPVSDYNRRFDSAVYGNLNGTIAETFQAMIPITDLAETYEMNDLVLWKQVIPQREKQIKLGGSDWMTVSEITRQADSLLSTARPACYNEDLDYIRLIIDEYSYMAEGRFNLLEAAKLYRDACLIEKESREKAAALARQSGDLLTGCRIRLEELKALYARLWLLESKAYWLDHLMESFDEKINDYDDAEKLLEKTVSELIAGEFLAPPNEIRLDIQEQEGQYFQYWLLCGPFPNEGGEGRETDFLEGMGGEAAASPTPGFSFNAGIFGNIYWQKYASPLFSQVDLSSVYEKNERAVAYAFCRIYSPRREDVKATIGSNDGIQVFLNGRRIFKKYIKRSLIPDEDFVIMPLKEGRNDLLLKIDQNKGGWGFSFRLPDEKVRNHKYKYYIVD
jgi:hexosaminidase